jgi:hypothetical protein
MANLFIKKISNRTFIVGCIHNGNKISVVGKTRPKAQRSLESQLRMLGLPVPNWTVVEAPVNETPANVPPVRDTIPAPAPSPEETVAVVIPAAMDTGWITPVSDPDSYRDALNYAFITATGFEARQIRNMGPEQVADTRKAVTALMVAAGYIAPWSPGPGVPMYENGQKTDKLQPANWIRTLKGFYDPTTRPYKSGEGERREAFARDINGLHANTDKLEAFKANERARRDARKGKVAGVATAKAPAVNKSDAIKARADFVASPETRKLAHKAGSMFQAIAKAEGLNAGLAYKLGYVMSLASQKVVTRTDFAAVVEGAASKDKEAILVAVGKQGSMSVAA